MNRKKTFGFTIIELLVVISIIGILAVLVAVTIGPIQKRSRDSKRKADINLILGGANQFYADFKVYPNSTMYLGTNTTDAGAKNSSLGLGSDVAKCAVLGSTSPGYPSNFVTDATTSRTVQSAGLSTVANYNNWVLKPGFAALNQFLVCLKYVDRLVTDPNQSAATGYQYRVSYDYSEVIFTAQLENSADKDAVTKLFSDGYDYSPSVRFFEGNGKTNRQLDEDSNTTKFYATGQTVVDGKYLYQCWNTSAGAAINRDDRATSAYQPINISGTTYIINPSCQATTAEVNVGVQAY